jgi:hypothetical protein
MTANNRKFGPLLADPGLTDSAAAWPPVRLDIRPPCGFPYLRSFAFICGKKALSWITSFPD